VRTERESEAEGKVFALSLGIAIGVGVSIWSLASLSRPVGLALAMLVSGDVVYGPEVHR
jgi:hypothetical protein